MIRYQIFETPHKALRLALSELLTLAGKTDFSNLDAVYALADNMKSVFTLIYSHSHHEDDLFFEALDQIAPGATQHDRNEHVRLHNMLDRLLLVDMNAILNRLELGENQAAAGIRLYTDLCNLHAEMLNHMMEEERDTQPVFWQHMTDEAIIGMLPRLFASMTPEMSALWMRYIIPSQTPAGLQAMFHEWRQTAPSFVFEGNLRLAESVLTPGEYRQLTSALQMKMAFA